jgi:hypothetical protein
MELQNEYVFHSFRGLVSLGHWSSLSLCHRDGSMRDLGGDWANFRLQRHLATGHQHRNDRAHLPYGVRVAALAESRRSGDSGEDSSLLHPNFSPAVA